MSEDLQNHKRRIARALLLWNLGGGGVLALASLYSFSGALPKRILMAAIFAAFGVLSGVVNRRNYLRS